MSYGATINVLVVEDFELLREGLAQFLSLCDGIEVIGTAANGEEAISQCDQLQPHVVLMDVGMPVMDGVEATRHIHERYPHIQIVILTNSFEDSRRQEAFDAGARAYLRKGVTVEGIAETIRAMVM
jgi:DNA-binding NarL/FixJ family response regulator